MPVRWLTHPKTGAKLTFEEAPGVLEADGVMPSYAVEAIIREHTDVKPAFNVRPSDVAPKFVCRRQRVWMASHDYGINPLEAEGMVEGSALHEQLGAMEIEVPSQPTISTERYLTKLEVWGGERRLDVCGVPMRGRIDWLYPDRIEDLKTSTPFWITKYGAKGSGTKPWVDIWLPNADDDIKGWRLQLSIYRVLLEKSGQPAPSRGRVWKRWSGVKADKVRWQRFDFDLLNEAGLESEVGPWARNLYEGLANAERVPEAWRGMPADGHEMVGSRGNKWKCLPCPLKKECDAHDGMAFF